MKASKIQFLSFFFEIAHNLVMVLTMPLALFHVILLVYILAYSYKVCKYLESVWETEPKYILLICTAFIYLN